MRLSGLCRAISARTIVAAAVEGKRLQAPRAPPILSPVARRRFMGLAANGRFTGKDLKETMSRMTPFSSPLLLGFDAMEKTLERVAKASDGYPPYNIERIRADGDNGDSLRITLAVAGFTDDELDVSVDENQLIIKGRQNEGDEREYLHRGIAARQFQRVFVLADGIKVLSAELKNGLLAIDLARPEPQRLVKKINISVRD
jgi:HSP20 family molecular chaperone IbpA